MKLSFGLIAGAAVSAAATAYAQTPPPAPDDGQRDVVVVTGIGPPRASDELIANTTALDQEAISDRLAGGLGDTLAGLPGVSSASFGPGASRPVIRGLGAERVQVLTNGIGVIDASAASPDHSVTSDPLGAERIEILRGPASLAYGGGASGGVINVVDGLIPEARPDKALTGGVYWARTSADEGQQLAGRLAGAFGDFVAVVNASRLDTGDVDIPGFALSPSARSLALAGGADPGDFVYGKLRNSAVDNRSVSAGLTWVGDGAFLGGAVRRLDNRYGAVAEPTVFIDMNQTRYDLRGGVDLENGWLKSINASGSHVDYQHTEFEGPGVPGTVFTSGGWEARLEARHADIAGLEGSVGVQASDRDLAALGAETFIRPTRTRQTGVFVFETFDQGDWGLEGGLRYDSVDLRNITEGAPGNLYRSFQLWNASFGAHVHIGEHAFLGASLASTERAPSDVELFAEGPHVATDQFLRGEDALDTEKGVNLELTARWEDEAFNLGASLYRFKFDRFIYLADQSFSLDDLPVFDYVQAGATFTGFELQADARLGSVFGVDWKADASADLVRAEVDGGDNLPLIPPFTINAGIEGVWGDFTGRAEVQHAARQDRPAAFETPTEGYTTFDIHLSYQVSEGVRVMLEGRNLTDEEVRLHTSPLKEKAPQAGRNFRIAIRADF